MLALAQKVYDHFGDIDYKIVNRAIQMHIEDDRLDSRGNPIGRTPPSIADLVAHVHSLTNQARATQEAHQRRQESDLPYRQILDSSLWRDEFKKGQDIRHALQARFPKMPRSEFWRLLMGVLGRVSMETGLGTVDEALAVVDAVIKDKEINCEPSAINQAA